MLGISMENSLTTKVGHDECRQAPFFEIDQLTMSYGAHIAVSELSLQVAKGEFVSVIGPSGCGKSSMLQALSGLQQPKHGAIRLSGETVTNGLSSKISVGYVFQDHRLLPWRTVTQNLSITLGSARVPRGEWDFRIERYLKMLQVFEYRDSWPLNLSGGQRQRVSIARALAIHPDLILMDEPFSGLDEVTARSMRQELVSLWQSTGVSILFVTHSIRESLFLSDRVVILSRGPARVVKEIPVKIPRPRRYEDAELAELEGLVVADVLDEWAVELTSEI